MKKILGRISIAKKKFREMAGLLTSHDLFLATKLHLTNCYIYIYIYMYVWSTAFFYICEKWTLTAALERRLRAFEMRTFRRICSISWTEKKSNLVEFKNNRDNHPDKEKKLQCFGHIRRQDSL